MFNYSSTFEKMKLDKTAFKMDKLVYDEISKMSLGNCYMHAYCMPLTLLTANEDISEINKSIVL